MPGYNRIVKEQQAAVAHPDAAGAVSGHSGRAAGVGHLGACAPAPPPRLPHIIILLWSSALPPCHNDYNTRCGIKCQQFF